MCISYYVVYQCGCYGPTRIEECAAYWDDECPGVTARPQQAPHKCNSCRKKSERYAAESFEEAGEEHEGWQSGTARARLAGEWDPESVEDPGSMRA
jgi:hypothetical protein